MLRARQAMIVSLGAVLMSFGCTARNVDFSTMQKPDRASELSAFDVFVGEWDWKATVVNATDADKNWTGTAQWSWILDRRCLHGSMSAKSANAEFEAAGVWSWHPKQKNYIWWMFNNWGYPQQGTAKYNADTKHWTMPFKSVGLDGTTSYGLYTLTVINNDKIDWTLAEWADALHSIKKYEMTGTYVRRH